MSDLHLVSLPLDLRLLRQWAARRGFGLDEGRVLHHLLTETFGKGALRPFRLMVAPKVRCGTLLAYTRSGAAALRRTAIESGFPDALSVCDPASLVSKAMPSVWTEGRRLSFDLRARPVRRLHRAAGVFPRGAEVDAFLVEAIRRFPDGPPAEHRVNRETVYRQWLDERLAVCARLGQVRIARLVRRTVERHGKRVDGPEVTFHGELHITDSTAFKKCLATGVGRHTTFGYGMLLLRPVG